MRSCAHLCVERGFRYDIVQFLEKYYGISMNLRTIKSRLREYGM